MHFTKRILAVALSLVMIISLVVVGVNASQKLDEENGKWVSAWSTSMVDASIDDLFDALGAAKISGVAQQIGLSVLKNVAVSLDDITCRSTIQPTIEGEAVRLTLSNVFGAQDVVINRMTAARSSQNAPNEIDVDTLKNVTVNGNPVIKIPAGKTVVTDPIDMPVDERDSVAFTMYIKDKESIRTVGLIGGDSYIQKGDGTTTASINKTLHLQYVGDFGEYSVIPFIADMQVLTEPDDNARAAVILGDSTMTNDIPIYLSEKLDKEGINVSILQEAIKGNEVLNDGKGTIGNILGQSAIKRFERDVLDHEGVRYLIIKVGCNDIVHSRCTSLQDEYAGLGDAEDGGISASQVIAGYETIINKVNAHNASLPEDQQIKVYFVSRALWNGYTRNLFNKGDDVQWTPEIADQMVLINRWLYKAANGGANGYTIDGFIDITSMENKDKLGALRDGYTKDGVHLTDIAQRAFCNIFPMSIFKDGSTVVSDDDFYFSGTGIFDFDDFIHTKRSAEDFYESVEIPDVTPGSPAPDVTTTKAPVTEPTTTETTAEPTTKAPATTTTTEATKEEETSSGSLVVPPTSTTKEETKDDTTTTTKATTTTTKADDSTSVDLSGISAKLSKLQSIYKKVASIFSKLSDFFSKLFG